MNAVSSQVLVDAWRVLSFRKPSPALATQWQAYLAFGLACTWLAGIGRYWDSTRARLWQHLGLGSLAYVFVLAALLWVVMLPLRPKHWSYRNVLVFVTLTAPPALLYAIPVERFMPMADAQLANVWFLAIVAAWRVALLGWCLRVVAGMHWARIVVGGLLPLVLVVVALTLLNLEHAVFEIMAGIDPAMRTGNDAAYEVVLLIAFYSVPLFPFLLLAYLVLALGARAKRD